MTALPGAAGSSAHGTANDDAGYYQATREDIAALLPARYHRVLEIGCGEGRFSTCLAAGTETWGVEPMASAASQASHRMHRVLVGIYEDVESQLPDDYFDLVVCNDVIEHMIDHDRFFAAIKKKMTRDARLVGSVPNVRYFWNLYSLLVKKDWSYSDSGLLDRTHLRWFTAKSLKRTLASHGLVVEAFEGINGLTFDTQSASLLLKSLAVRALVVGSFGFYRDVQYLQFAFRAARA